jgi:murein DD-endopeptidase MepM/ murein hydrolase activator NlpD
MSAASSLFRFKNAVYPLLLFLVSCSFSGNNPPTIANNIPDTTLTTAVKPTLTFGIPSDSFVVLKGHIRPNRFLSEILEDYGVSATEVEQVVRNSKAVFDVRDLRAGRDFIVLADKDSTAKLRYFIYSHEPALSYIFSFNDSLNITPFRYESRSVIKFSSGTIESSLWDAVINNGINPELVIELSDIYAWTIDFFGLQKGDSFRVIYEEKFIGEKSIGIGKIFGALFTCSGRPVYAIPMMQNGTESFYDKDGSSLKKAFLKAPLHFSGIGSRFSSARMHPILRIVRPHYGVDYSAPAGTPVYSIGDGKVISATIEGESGRIVRIRHNSVYTTAYLHLSGFAKGIAGGVSVRQGDVIGYVGSSGLSTGPHLDFRFYKNGYPVDPLRVEAPSVEPVLEENRQKFEKISSIVIPLLSSINQIQADRTSFSIITGK